MSKKLLAEMFGVGGIVPIPAINEVTPHQVNKELDSARSVFKAPQRGQGKHTSDTARMQADVDSAQSLVKREEAGQQGITLSGDKETLGALQEALQEAEHSAESDVANWAGRAWKAVAAGIRGNGSFSLPRFEATPDDMMPDDDGGEEF